MNIQNQATMKHKWHTYQGIKVLFKQIANASEYTQLQGLPIYDIENIDGSDLCINHAQVYTEAYILCKRQAEQ